jgi:hypothetical protein
MNATDFLVDTTDPDRLDQTLNQYGAALVGGGMPGGYTKKDGYYIMRIFGNPRFAEFIITNQTDGKIIRRLDNLT